MPGGGGTGIPRSQRQRLVVGLLAFIAGEHTTPARARLHALAARPAADSARCPIHLCPAVNKFAISLHKRRQKLGGR